MAIKTLRYIVNADGVSPNYELKAGMQYDHKRTDLQFTLDSEFYDEIISFIGDDSAVYRFDCYDGEGKLHTGNIKELVSISLEPYELEYWVTKFGGKLKINLIITVSNNDITTKEWSYEVRLYLEDLPESDIDEGQYQSLSTLAIKTTETAKLVDENYEKILSMYKKLTALENLLKDGEWIFDGEAGSDIDIEFVIDNEFDADSGNALANKVITERFAQLSDNISKLTENIGQNVYESVIGEIKAEILKEAHPIGSYYWSDEATEPSMLFGGMWQQVKDVFVLAAGDKFGCGSTGGEAEHKLTEKEMPQHFHMFSPSASVDGIDFVVPTKSSGTGLSSIKKEGNAHYPGHWASSTWGTNKKGGNQAHNNMPPYIATYCWKRIG